MPSKWCNNWKKTGTCTDPDCAQEHYIRSAAERIYFKTRMCRNGSACTVKFCTNAHYADERRCATLAETRRCDDARCPYRHIGRPDPTSDGYYDEDTVCATEGARPRGGTISYARPLPQVRNSRTMGGIAKTKQDARRAFDPPKKVIHDLLSAFKGRKTDELRLYRIQLEIEEAQQHHDIRNYDLENGQVKRGNAANSYEVPCPGLSEQRPSVLKGDAVLLRDLATKKMHKGFVTMLKRDSLLCNFAFGFSDRHRVHVVFTVPRGPLLLQHRALRDTPFTLRPKLLQPSTVRGPLVEGDRRYLIHKLHECGVWGRLDDSQQDFVATFFRARSCLNLLHGPPGTGKTTTVVGLLAALRYLDLPANFRVLICTPSNKSADLIAERLVETTERGDRRNLRRELIRVNALSRDPKDMPAVLRDYSVEAGLFPDLATLQSRRFVVSTLCTAGKIYGVGDQGYDLLVVDEAGQCTEQELLVAVTLLKSAPEKGRVVLAGDHKQLGPMIRNKLCRETQMHVSPLQRLMQDASEAACSTMLRCNYRAHRDIVALYNPTYDNQLIPKAADEPRAMRFIGNFPFQTSAVMSLHVDGVEQQDQDSPSWRNDAEAVAVMDLVANVMSKSRAKPSDIVVLSGYAKQCAVIRELLRNKFYTAAPGSVFELTGAEKAAYGGKCPIEVCSVEKFQGREAPIVIVSTVRSRDIDAVKRDLYIGLGFISNPQRCNVAISRPQAGLAIVGNLELLSCDNEWSRIIQTIASRGGVYRETPSEFLPLTFEDIQRGGRRYRDALNNERARAENPAYTDQGAEREWHRRE